MSYCQFHRSLQDLDLCIQCLATRYLEFQTGELLISCLLQLKSPRSFLYYAGNFSYYAGIMLYAFQPLLCLELCQHNQLQPTIDAMAMKNFYRHYPFMKHTVYAIYLAVTLIWRLGDFTLSLTLMYANADY